VSDLCQLAADRDPRLREWCERDGLVILACHPRAVRNLFLAADAPLATGVRLLNLRTQSVTELTALLQLPVPNATAPAGQEEPPWVTPGWIPWFPVIDRNRCTNCRQCLSFCLFGVYTQGADGRVQVTQPRNCKTHCPACARICPEVAIVFPKSAEGAISGAEIEDEAAGRAQARKSAAEILGSDPCAALQRRNRRPRGRLLSPES
jgi:NAD-dependent dihydropyrimidine dehydrogenase PreA subunit